MRGLESLAPDVVRYLGSIPAHGKDARETAANQAAVAYSIERYETGLDHYARAFESIGMTGRARGLDIGSGAGHWCRAFLEGNSRVVGMDIRREYTAIARDIAVNFGFADRADFVVGNVERLPFAGGSFDCCWSHGVLMFADLEQAISEIARVLEPEGLFYCAYSTMGTRLLQLIRAIGAGSSERLRSHAVVIVEAALIRCGLHHTIGSRVGLADYESLLGVCDVFGLDFVSRPNVQDLGMEYLGASATVDFVVRKKAGAPPELGAGPIDDRWIAQVERLLQIGCGATALRILRDRLPEAAARPRLEALYGRALLQTGQSGKPEARGLLEGLADRLPALTGLYWLDRRQPDKALPLFARSDHPERLFLIGMCHMRQRSFGEAQAVFREILDADRSSIAAWAGLLQATIEAGDLAGAVDVLRRMVGARRDFGASAEEVSAILATIDAAPALGEQVSR